SSGDLSMNHFVYRSSADAETYDQPANPDNLSTYHFMQGAQYVSAHDDLDLVAGQQVGLVCESTDGQMLTVFEIYIQGATHTFAAWISAGEWADATITGGVPISC
ncbi:MAG TPA: hypothetical protein VMB79_11525, partial [Jatrophihabitans sp.]|nr:hypothetical protein [Jatrophihabitans sp.]